MFVRTLLPAALLIPLLVSLSSPQTPAAPAQLKLRHIHIQVKDVDRTKAFYRDKLGLPVSSERAGEMVAFAGGALWFGKADSSGPLHTDAITIGFEAESVDAAYQALQQRGVSLPHSPQQHPFGRSFSFQDPDGYEVQVEGDFTRN